MMKHKDEELQPETKRLNRNLALKVLEGVRLIEEGILLREEVQFHNDLPLAVDYFMQKLWDKNFSIDMELADFISLLSEARTMELNGRKAAIQKAPIICYGSNLWIYKDDGKIYIRPTSDMAKCTFDADDNNHGFSLCRKCGRAKQQHEAH